MTLGDRVRLSRRNFLAGSASASALVAGAPQLARADGGRLAGLRISHRAGGVDLDAIVDRLIPADAIGPGGVEAGVVTFIDRQLAGRFGAAAEWYMQGPWAAGTPSQGWQLALAPALIYRKGLLALERWCRGTHGKGFSELAPAEQDDALRALEAGTVDLDGMSSAVFFELVRENAVEGYLSDPLYGGNRNMAAWKMIGFPGANPVLTPALALKGDAYVVPPMAIGG